MGLIIGGLVSSQHLLLLATQRGTYNHHDLLYLACFDYFDIRNIYLKRVKISFILYSLNSVTSQLCLQHQNPRKPSIVPSKRTIKLQVFFSINSDCTWPFVDHRNQQYQISTTQIFSNRSYGWFMKFKRNLSHSSQQNAEVKLYVIA